MRAVQIRTFGEPGIVLELADLPEPPAPTAGQVLIGVEHAPINMNDLDEIQVIHVDRRMLDTDQHLACGRCWRFGEVGKFEDDSRLAESSDLQCTHSAPPVLVLAE